MANIIEGVPFRYVPPKSAGSGIPIEATSDKELRTADMTERQLLVLQCRLLFSILTELRIGNENMFPGVRWDNERTVYGETLRDEIENLNVD